LLADDVPEDAKDRYSPVVCPALRLSGFARLLARIYRTWTPPGQSKARRA
jgi:hypothetical protein